MYKRVWCTCEVVVLLIKRIVFLTFLLSSASLDLKVPNVRQSGRCVISILKEFCFFATDFNTNYLSVLTNCQSKSFNCNHGQIWRKRITLPHAPFQRKESVARPLLITQLYILWYRVLTHQMNYGPKPQASKQLKRKFHSKLSNALWKSIKIIKLGIFSFRENFIKSKIDRTVSPLKRSFTKQLWLWLWIMLGRTFFILVAKTLASTLTSEIGLQFSKRERPFLSLQWEWSLPVSGSVRFHH